MQFAIAHFLLRNEVEVVPCSWIIGSQCAWPNVPISKVKRMIKGGVPPSPDWTKYAIQVKGVFSSYEEGRKRLPLSEFTSDLGSDSPLKKRVPKRKYISDSDTDESLTKCPRRAHQERKKTTKRSQKTQKSGGRLMLQEDFPHIPENFPAGLCSAESRPAPQDGTENSTTPVTEQRIPLAVTSRDMPQMLSSTQSSMSGICDPILPDPCESTAHAAENAHYGPSDTALDVAGPSGLSQALHPYDTPTSACSAPSAFHVLPYGSVFGKSSSAKGGDSDEANSDSASHKESDNSTQHVQGLSSLRSVAGTSLRPNSAFEVNASYPLALDRYNTPTSSSPSNVTPPCSAPAASVHHVLPHAEFQRQVLRQLHVIRLMLQQQADFNQHLSGNPLMALSSKPRENIIKKPFDSLEEFKAFDESLTPELEEKLTRELQYLGGKDVKTTTRRILGYVITTRVAKNFSWVGHKGKEKFCLLKTSNAIMNAVKGNRKIGEVSAFEIESVIQSYLRHAN